MIARVVVWANIVETGFVTFNDCAILTTGDVVVFNS